MTIGYRSIILLVIGWLILASAAPPKRTEPAEPAKVDVRSRAPQFAPYQGYDPDPCYHAKSYEAADLCAQWRAAVASEKAAEQAKRATDYSIIATILSAIGAAAVLYTLVMNHRSRRDTIRALEAAETSARAATTLAAVSDENAKRQLRAYADFDCVRMERYSDFDGEGPDQVGARLIVRIKNFGVTPCQNVEMSVTTRHRPAGSDNLYVFTPEDRTLFSTIAPADHVTKRAFWRLPLDVFNNIDSGDSVLNIAILVTYTDVFGDGHILRSDFESHGIKKDFGFIHGTRDAT